MLTIGIDPGLGGGIAGLWGKEVIAIKDMPVMEKSYGKGNQVNPVGLASILMEMRVPGKPVRVIIEQVGAMPKQGVSSMFSFGDSFGVLRGVCGALQYSMSFVIPQTWQKRAGLIGESKDAGRILAIERHPEMYGFLKRKKDNGRADAILIAEFGIN